MLVVVAPVIQLLSWFHSQALKGNVSHKNDFPITTIKRVGVTNPTSYPIEITGTYGDIFKPYLGGVKRTYDVIVVSATLDPLYTVDKMLIWESNLLVRSSLAYSITDPQMKDSMVQGLLLKMLKKNQEFIDFMTHESSTEIKYRRDYVTAKCEPLLQPTVANSQLRKAGVRWIAIIPLFNSRNISDKVERDKKLAMNVRIGVGRLINDFNLLSSKYEDYRVRTIAFPALAGTENLSDSHYYLTYQKSFQEIYNGICSRNIPDFLERIYLVVWDKWEQFYSVEKDAAIAGLTSLYYKLNFQKHLSKIISQTLLIILGLSYVFSWLIRNPTHRNLKSILTSYWQLLLFFLFAQIAGLFVAASKISNFLLWSFDFGGTFFLIFVETILGIIFVTIGNKLKLPHRKKA